MELLITVLKQLVSDVKLPVNALQHAEERESPTTAREKAAQWRQLLSAALDQRAGSSNPPEVWQEPVGKGTRGEDRKTVPPANEQLLISLVQHLGLLTRSDESFGNTLSGSALNVQTAYSAVRDYLPTFWPEGRIRPAVSSNSGFLRSTSTVSSEQELLQDGLGAIVRSASAAAHVPLHDEALVTRVAPQATPMTADDARDVSDEESSPLRTFGDVRSIVEPETTDVSERHAIPVDPFLIRDASHGLQTDRSLSSAERPFSGAPVEPLTPAQIGVGSGRVPDLRLEPSVLFVGQEGKSLETPPVRIGAMRQGAAFPSNGGSGAERPDARPTVDPVLREVEQNVDDPQDDTPSMLEEYLFRISRRSSKDWLLLEETEERAFPAPFVHSGREGAVKFSRADDDEMDKESLRNDFDEVKGPRADRSMAARTGKSRFAIEYGEHPTQAEEGVGVTNSAQVSGGDNTATGQTAIPESTGRLQQPNGSRTAVAKTVTPHAATVSPDALGDVIRRAVYEGNGRAQSMRVELHPQEMGRLHLRVTLERGTVNAQIQAEYDHTRRLLEAALPELRHVLESGGLTVGSLQVGIGTDPGSLGWDQQERRDGDVRRLNVDTVRPATEYGVAGGRSAPTADDDALINVLA